MLTKMGFEIVVAGNGKDALGLLETTPCKLVLMDCQMPVMDGYQATAAIRSREAGGVWHVPIIALTANAMPGDIEKCLEAGMDDYLSKPYSATDLSAALSRWVPLPKRDMPTVLAGSKN
jgi:two-component system, sensor histidine kinase and response regulator